MHSVGRAASARNGLFPVTVRLPDDADLRPGTTAEVLLEDPRQGSLTVPLNAILNPGGSQPTVLRLKDGSVRRIAVTIGALHGDRIGVTSDELAVGHQVVITGHTALVDGDRVEVLP